MTTNRLGKKSLVILFLISSFGFILRVWGAGFGLPNFFFHTDESFTFTKGVNFFDSKLRPAEFVTIFHLYIYWQYKIYLFIREFIVGHNPIDFQIKGEFIFLERITSAITSTTSIILTFLIARKIFEKDKIKIALISSMFLATGFIDVVIGHYFKEDTYIQFFSLLILLFIFSVKKRNWFIWFLLGLLSTIKMNILVYIVPLLFPYFGYLRKFRFKKIATIMPLFILVIIGFIGGHPLAWFERSYFTRYWQFFTIESIHLPGVDSSNGMSSFLWWLSYLSLSGMYWPFFLASATGFIILIKRLSGFAKPFRERLLSVISVAGVYLILLFIRPNRFDRHITLISPILAIFAAYSLFELSEFFRNKFSKIIFIFSQIIILLVFFVPSIVRAIKFDAEISKTDAREQAAEWIESNIPKDRLIFTSGDAINIGQFLQTKKYGLIMNLVPLEKDDVFMFGGEAILIDSVDINKAKNYQNDEMYGKYWKNYQVLKQKGKIIKEFSSPLFKSGYFSPVFLEHSSTVNAYHNPTVEIFTIPKLNGFYDADIEFDYLAEKMDTDMSLIDKNGIKMLYSDGSKDVGIYGPYFVFPAGNYVLDYFLKDVRCEMSKSKITLQVTSGGGAREFAKKVFPCNQVTDRSQFSLSFSLKSGSTLELILLSDRGTILFVEKASLNRISLIE